MKITPIQDCILGTSIQGTTHTVGQATAKLAESDRFAVIDTYLMATAYSNTVGRNGPVCIYSNGTTRIGAVKRLWIDENGLFSLPASFQCRNEHLHYRHSIDQRPEVHRTHRLEKGRQAVAEGRMRRLAPCRSPRE